MEDGISRRHDQIVRIMTKVSQMYAARGPTMVTNHLLMMIKFYHVLSPLSVSFTLYTYISSN